MLSVSRSAFYDWLKRRSAPNTKRDALRAKVVQLHDESRESAGARMISQHLKAQQCWHRCGINLVSEVPLTQPDSSRPLSVLGLCRSRGGLVGVGTWVNSASASTYRHRGRGTM
ncbi:hypothetical protein EMIT0P176_10132 [Pseudomonas sp. IT-P176]